MVTPETYLRWQETMRRRPWLRRFWMFCGLYIVGLYILYGFYLATSEPGQRILILGAAAFGAAWLISTVFYQFYPTQRPSKMYGFVPYTSRLWSRDYEKLQSMPSRHAASASAPTMVLFLFNPQLGALAFVFVLFTAAGRVVLGYHFVSDVVVGILLGLVCGLAAYYIGHAAFPALFTS
jgi:undecaprenyl-diphosphatase